MSRRDTAVRPPQPNPFRRAGALVAALFLGVLAAGIASHAAAASPEVNETCLACHGDKDAKGAAGKSIAVDGATFVQSVHGEMHAQVHRLSRRCLAPEAAASGKAQARQLRHLPRQGGEGIRLHGSWDGAHGGQHRRRDVHGLPRIARYQARQGSDLADQPREPRGHVRQVPRQRRDGGERQAAGRQHRHPVPRQHSRQGADRRRGGLRPDVHELPRRPHDPREIRRRQRDQSGAHPGHVRHLPPEGAGAVRDEPARQDAAGRQPGRARLQRLPQRASHPAAYGRELPDRGDQGMRQLPFGPPVDLSRHVPRPGHGARVRAHGDLRVVSRLARDPARVQSGVDGLRAESAQDLPEVSRRRHRELRQLRPAREPARSRGQPALLFLPRCS